MNSAEADLPEYESQLDVPYVQVDGWEGKLNIFRPRDAGDSSPCILYFHGGWWSGGGRPARLQNVPGWETFARKKLVVIGVSYRLAKEGGFPQNVRDCRNAVRFLRKNAARFRLDPERIGCTGISAGGYLAYMVAVVPEDFDDGGPTEALSGVSARVCSAFGYIGPTDLLREWNEGPDDVVIGPDGKVSYRAADPNIPNDARPRHRVLFKGITPDTPEHQALYLRMSPISHIRGDTAPLLICDGEKDPIVPGLEGKVLYEKLKAAGADVTYWMTPGGGHGYPGGAGFQKMLDDFLDRTFHLSLP